MLVVLTMPPRDLDSKPSSIWLCLADMLNKYGDYGNWPPHSVFVSNGRPYFRPEKLYRL